MENVLFKIFVVFSEFLIAIVEGIMISNDLAEDISMLPGYVVVVLLTYAAAFAVNFLIFSGELKN